MGQVAVVFFVPVITGAQNVTGRLGRAPTVKWVPMVTAAICVQIMCWDQNALSVGLAIGDCQKMVAEPVIVTLLELPLETQPYATK